jgi:hypothetical protein
MVFDPLGHKVTVAKTVLHGHIYRRHPELHGKQAIIEKTVADPDFIARSKKDGHSLLYFRRIKGILMLMVEDSAVTWGNFFQNINWNVSAEYLDTSDVLLVNNDTKKVTYILNGEEVSNITNKVIGDKDRLLVSYGSSSKDELSNQFDTVATTAEKYNITKDPASCSGGHSEDSIKDRLKNLF